MKKSVCAVLMIALFAAMLTLAGCGENKNSEIVGEWVPATATINGETVQFGDLDVDSDKFGFVFKENGSCEITIAGTKNNGTYLLRRYAYDELQLQQRDHIVYVHQENRRKLNDTKAGSFEPAFLCLKSLKYSLFVITHKCTRIN